MVSVAPLKEREKPIIKSSPEYLTVRECQTICRFKGPEPIRRAVYRGDLPATRVRANRLLIKASDFWKWFHRNDVKPRKVVEVAIFDPGELESSEVEA